MTPSPISKPYDSMTIDELKHERAAWSRLADDSYAWGSALAFAIKRRSELDALITRRLAEQKQERAA